MLSAALYKVQLLEQSYVPHYVAALFADRCSYIRTRMLENAAAACAVKAIKIRLQDTRCLFHYKSESVARHNGICALAWERIYVSTFHAAANCSYSAAYKTFAGKSRQTS